MAEQEIVKIINIKTDQAINTVKELKNYINELRDDLVKVDKNSKEYEETLEEIAKAQTKLTEVTKDSKNAMNYAEGSYRALNQELVNLRNEYKNLSEAERNNAAVGGAMLSRIQELDAELKDIDATLGNHQRNVGNYKSAIEDVTVSYASQRQELKALRVALEQLDPTTEQYNKLFNRAAEITHNLTEQQEMLKYSSSDLGDQLSNIRGIASNMAAGFSALSAAMSLFGNNNEDVKKALLKTQQAMAIVQGLQGMDGLLKRTQGLSTAMKVWYQSTIQATAGLGKAAAATKVLTTAQKGLNAAMKANPIGIILTAVMALSVGIKPLINWIEKLTGKFDKMNSSASASTASMAELDKTISEIDRENNLEAKLMQASGFSQIAVIQKQIEGEQEKLNEETKEYAKQVSILKDNIYLYGKENTITTGTLKEMGYNEEQIKTITEELKGKVVESDKVLKNFTKNDGFKTMLDNVLQLNTGIKDIRKNIQNLQDDSKVASVKSAVDAAKEAAKKREEIEKNYQSKIQNVYGNTIRETLNSYKEELNTLQEYLTQQLKNPKIKKETKESIKELISEVKKEIKRVGGVDILQYEDMSGNFKKLQKAFTARFKDGIENSGKEIQTKLNDEVIKLFEKTLQPDINKEIAKIENELDVINLKFSFESETGYDFDVWSKSGLFQSIEGFNQKQVELANVAETSKIKMKELTTELKHYQDIVDFVQEAGDLIPSEEYDKALQKVKELNVKIEQENVNRWQREQAVNKKYFQQSIATAQQQTQQAIDVVNDKYDDIKNDKGVSFLGQLLGFDNNNEIQLEKQRQEEIYNIEREGLEKIKELWAERAADESLSLEERANANSNFYSTLRELRDLDVNHQQQEYEEKKRILQGYINAAASALGTIGQMFSIQQEMREQDIENQKKENKISDKEAERQFEQSVKPLMIAQATISMLQGIVSAWATAMPLGFPANVIVGASLSTLLTAVGIMNIAKIKQQKYNGGSSGGGSASVPAPDTSYNYQPMYVANTTGEQDTENLRNSLTESPIRAYVVESDITESQNRTKKRNSESDF